MSVPHPERRLRRHSRTRVVVLEDAKVLFLPIPKSGCTSVLWALADLAGLPRERFQGSTSAEVSRTMCVHDMTLWEEHQRWSGHDPESKQRIREAEGWLRFSVVRDPAPRLWSAWQSKILLREPRFVERFGDESWFPGSIGSVGDVVTSFRAFVSALDTAPDAAPHDAHWGVQHLLMSDFDLNFVGRAERPAETMQHLAAHLSSVRRGSGSALPREVPRENRNPLSYHPSVYDQQSADILNRVYAADFDAFGYPPFEVSAADGAAEWIERCRPRLELVSQLIERHLRIGELLAIADSRAEELAELRAHLDYMERSRSWQITRPLRAIRRRGGPMKEADKWLDSPE